MTDPFRTPTTRGMTVVWTAIPDTVRWILQNRDKSNNIEFRLRCGLNADLIILSAVCVDGCAVECLKASIPESPTGNEFQARLQEEFYKRAAEASGISVISDLFRVVLGKTLKESISDELRDSLAALISFRNHLCHGRSTEFRSYHVGPTGWDYELEHWGGLKAVEDYLKGRGLLAKGITDGATGYDFLTNDIANHFTGLIEPICREIIHLLPSPACTNMKDVLDRAFEKRI